MGHLAGGGDYGKAVKSPCRGPLAAPSGRFETCPPPPYRRFKLAVWTTPFWQCQTGRI